MDTTMKTSSDATWLGQDNAQAFLKSGQIWTSGCQAIGQSVAIAMQGNLEDLMAGWKAMSGVKSLKEAVAIQARLVHTCVENTMVSTRKMTEVTMALVEKSIAPLTANMTRAVETLSNRAD